VCKQCNSGFSLDEEYFITFLSCVLSGSTAPEAQVNPKIQRALARNPALVARLDAAKQAFTTPAAKKKSSGNQNQNASTELR
jgi:hypothetical protein